MRRLLTKVRPFYIRKINIDIGYNNYKYELYPTSDETKTAAFFEADIVTNNNEIILGLDYNDPTYTDLFIVKKSGSSVKIYSLSYDDFSLSYVHKELVDLDEKVSDLEEMINSLDNNQTPVIISDIKGGG
jgi:hypothetical protein